MTAFKSKEELLRSIKDSFEAINHEKMDIAKMDELVNSSRELYERTLIIRHKVLELLVAEKPISFEKDIISDNFSKEEEEEIAPLTTVVEEEEESEDVIAHISEEEVEVQLENEEERNATSTFSVIDKEDDFAFDLFGGAESVDTSKTTSDEEFMPQEEEVEEEEMELPRTIGDIMRENPADLSVDLILEEEVQILEEKEKEENMSFDNPTSEPTRITSFFARYNAIADNPSAQMIAPKIESLTSAFGLGEKLMYIRELFDGSSDAFDHTVKTVEKVNSFEEAKSILNDYALSNGWSLEEQATLDFINKVERRFF